MSLGGVKLDIFDRLGKVSVGWVKLKIFSRLGKMSPSWVKLKFFINLEKCLKGLVKVVITTYRLREMSGWFGETGVSKYVVIVEDDFLECPSLPPPYPKHHLLTMRLRRW